MVSNDGAFCATHTQLLCESAHSLQHGLGAKHIHTRGQTRLELYLTKNQETAILLSLMASDSAEEASQCELKVYKAQ